ncbi:ABC transporter ATP-binding protein [Arsenicitalea aurantiaca]|uniref:ABC transporter ATP-binding protein n=1 Tax=Arsenicitalea aurantiaca TaxID=1783274 RepID=A0A433XBK3_9HYPH|nr:ABC transporter ATP-binding protein [Arsenicitalea aurantiaca]RUT31368.1 ABC transporter ATP-binding protein [Arsenicitalea aurantiaca]
MTPRLSVSDLAKAYDGLQVLDGLDLEVGKGEFVSLLGPSGAGKSTLFRLLTGGRPDRGTIRLDGAPIAEQTAPFAFMPQRDALMDWRTIIGNASLGLEIAGVPRHEARARVAPLFAEFGLSGFQHHYPAQLSGGMRQRAALLRTIVMDRPMLLLDEPFGALDALTRAGMQRWLAAMWQRHRWTALLITHDVREAILLSDRIYLLSPRPARVVAEIHVPLPRPRSQADLATPEALRIEARLLDTLLDPSQGQIP